MSAYESLTTAELLTRYNSYADALGENTVKRFSDRKTAERRLAAIEQRLVTSEQRFAETNPLAKVLTEPVVVETPAEPVVIEPVAAEPVAAEAPVQKKAIAPGRGRKTSIDLTKKIKIQLDPMRPTNPKRKGTRAWDVFELYGDKPLTGAAYIKRVREAGYSQKLAVDSLRWDLAHHFICFVEDDA